MVTCPQCGNPIEPTWDWCHHCGFDPEGLKPAGWQPTGAPAPRPAAAPPRPPSYGPPPGYGAPPGYASPGAPPYGSMGYSPPAYGGPSPAPSKRSSLVYVASAVATALVFFVGVTVARSAFTTKDAAPTKFSSVAKAIDDGPAVTTSTLAPAVWSEWRPVDQSFVVSFPGVPIVQPVDLAASTQQRVSNAQLVYDTSVRGDYFLTYMDLAPNFYIGDSSAVMNGAVDGFVKTMQFTFTSRDAGQFAGMPSLEFAGTDANKGKPVDVHGRVIISGKRVYLFAVGTEQGQSPADFETFIGSFHIAG